MSKTEATKEEPKKEEKKEEKKEDNKPKMEYRTLGGTGLKVSVFGYGYWGTFGAKETGDGRIAEAVKNSLPILETCIDAGINFFDNAEAYGKENGDAEKIMGLGFEELRKKDPKKYRRSEFVFTTKIFWGGSGQNERGLSRKHVLEAIDKSLKRLRTDYVDVVYCHRPDKITPTLEVVRAFTKVINDGKAFYWGTSEWTAQRITEAFWLAKLHNLIPPVVEQPEYNVFHREKVEKEFIRLYDAPYNMGTTIWGPLAAGWLTGKYNDTIPEGSRLKQYSFLAPNFEELQKKRVPIIKSLAKLAKERFDTTSTVLAIAWVVKNANVSVCLLGASKLYQIQENLKAFNVATKLTKKDMKDIEEIIGNKPVLPRDWGRNVEKHIETIN